MNVEQEKKYLENLELEVDNSVASAKKFQAVYSALYALAIVVGGFAYYLALKGDIDARYCVFIGFMGGIALGVASSLANNRKYIPILVSHLNIESIKEKLSQLNHKQ